MSNQAVKVKRDTIVACLTCPLCHRLLRDATTISECLHTFCRNCIYKKLSDEELECCPICNTDLGCAPLEKLRPDHNLEDVRAKIFPYKRRKVKAPEIVPSVALPVRRKERSLSSLVVSTPRVSTQTGMRGKRSKSAARKVLPGSTFPVERPIKNEEDSGEEPDSSSSPETLKRFAQNKRQNYSNTEHSSHPTMDKETDNGTEQWEGKVNLWNPLNCLVEVANKNKCSTFTSQGSIGKSGSPHCHDNEGQFRKTKVKKHGQKLKVQDDKNEYGPGPPESEKPKKLRKICLKKASTFGEFNVSAQTVLDSISFKCSRRTNPIWFSLVASEDQEGDTPLPQISASYLRIKDGNIPVSFIQKYLTRKLDLSSEDEVEIRYMGQLVVPTLQLSNLVDMWLQTTVSEIAPATVGSSAKDFVMVLAYARKVPSLMSS
ncbi:PREDICTED: E3 ubiquitin protein ligase DRIP2-like [Nicotiana attenuata]|uniref:E3 ubiquitin protein ligase drip2 n=1 Tax=Nicotiana attenuata TaxID=49451 RepID=A0A1J6JB44_NICAT|nr:PREDICTED: E3 ubiquitin protein ligase DRIP2-like [Nicotiana attenuata]OIT06927.1 e3 ubiquitin protein ligase drip2 [Nicotiana attenuata]